ncbi:MAG: hypothetical protein ACK50O_15085 [Pirellulaceae bacterium]
MRDQEIPSTANRSDPTTIREIHRKIEGEVSRHLNAAGRAQRKIVASMGATVVAAAECGRALLDLQAIAPTGQSTALITEGFCTPNGVSLKTAQRYMAIARQSEVICRQLREENKEWDQRSDQEILSVLSINQALDLIQKLRTGSQTHLGLTSAPPAAGRPSAADQWMITPEYASVIRQFCGRFQSDLTTAPDANPLEALRTIDIDAIDSTMEFLPGVHWSMPGTDKGRVDRICQLAASTHRQSTDREFLLLVPILSAAGSPCVAQYPRAFNPSPVQLMNLATGKVKAMSAPHMLLFVSSSDRFRHFAQSFSTSHHVYLPFQS